MWYVYIMYVIYLLIRGGFQMSPFWEFVTAAFLVIGAVGNLYVSFKQTKSTDNLIGSSKSELKTEHGSLSTEHSRLSTEHSGLSTEHRGIEHKIDNVAVSISKDQALIAKDVLTIAAATAYLKDESLKNQNNREALSKKELDLHDIMLQLADMIKENRELQTKNKELQKTIEIQQTQLEKLSHELKQTHTNTSAINPMAPQTSENEDEELEP